jgi:hypothetical protein
MRNIPMMAAKVIGYVSGKPVYEIAGGADNGFIPIKATAVIDAGLSLLERETVLANLVWRDAVPDFRGKLNDTVSIRLPAYAVANVRDLRSSDPRVRSKLFERKVDVTLNKGLQIDIPLSDEEQTLDITNFATQVIQPGLNAIVRGYEDAVVEVMESADYGANTVEVSATNVDNPDSGVYAALVDARALLNAARVPMAGRAAVIGSSLESQALKDPRLARADQSGSDSALRNAEIGRLAGFTLYSAPATDPDKGYAFHKSAFVLPSAVPNVPDGAPWGEKRSQNGFTIRVVQVLDSTTIENIVAFDAWLGSGIVTDRGSIDGDGRFVPAVDPDESGAEDLFVRAVELTAAS